MTCDGVCGAFAARELAYSHAPAFTLAVDALAAPIGWLRLGPSFRLTAANAVTPEGSSESLQAGHDVTLGVTVEAVPSLGPGWWLTPRLTAGPLLFVPGKELRDALAPGVCAPDAAATCDIAQGTKVGMSGSVGVGALVAARPGMEARLYHSLAQLLAQRLSKTSRVTLPSFVSLVLFVLRGRYLRRYLATRSVSASSR